MLIIFVVDRVESKASKEARLAAFLANLKMIREHNEAYELGETSYKMGLHSRSDWVCQEQPRRMQDRKSVV